MALFQVYEASDGRIEFQASPDVDAAVSLLIRLCVENPGFQIWAHLIATRAAEIEAVLAREAGQSAELHRQAGAIGHKDPAQ